MQCVAASVKIWWLNGQVAPRFVDWERGLFILFIHSMNMNNLPVSSFCQRRIIIVRGRLKVCDFFAFGTSPLYWQPPASVRVICLPFCFGSIHFSSWFSRLSCTYSWLKKTKKNNRPCLIFLFCRHVLGSWHYLMRVDVDVLKWPKQKENSYHRKETFQKYCNRL